MSWTTHSQQAPRPAVGCATAFGDLALPHAGKLPAARLSWRRRARPLLGTRVEIAILSADEAEFARVSELALARVAQYHAAMSFHEATSDVRRISSASAGKTLRINAETWAVIAAAQAFEAASEGIFNVAIAAELIARGHLPSPPVLPNGAAPAAIGASASACLRLEPGSRITIVHPVSIDLGGIAKGAAVDAALATIRETSAAAAIVNAGGDMALYGAEAQPITVRGPRGKKVLAGTLADGAIATSGPFTAATEQRADSCLVLHPDRRANWASRAVSVVAPTCMAADALTKMLAVLGPQAAPLLAQYAAQGFSIDAAGHVERVA